MQLAAATVLGLVTFLLSGSIVALGVYEIHQQGLAAWVSPVLEVHHAIP